MLGLKLLHNVGLWKSFTWMVIINITTRNIYEQLLQWNVMQVGLDIIWKLVHTYIFTMSDPDTMCGMIEMQLLIYWLGQVTVEQRVDHLLGLFCQIEAFLVNFCWLVNWSYSKRLINWKKRYKIFKICNLNRWMWYK